jgi:hypothetical protein
MLLRGIGALCVVHFIAWSGFIIAMPAPSAAKPFQALRSSV